MQGVAIEVLQRSLLLQSAEQSKRLLLEKVAMEMTRTVKRIRIPINEASLLGLPHRPMFHILGIGLLYAVGVQKFWTLL